MSDTHGLVNAGYSITFRNKVLTFRAITDAVRADITRQHREVALNDILDLKSTLPPKDYQAQLLGTRRDISGGVYDFGSPWHTDALGTIQGIAVFIRAVTGDKSLSDDDVYHLMLEHGETVAEYLKLLNPEAEGSAVP